MTLTVTDLRGHLSSALEDTALQLKLDAAYETIDDHLGIDDGAYDPVIADLITPGYGDLIRLSRRALSISSVVEGTTTLDPDDYELRPSGYVLRRLATGTHPASCWRARVDVRYPTVLDGAERDRIAIALVQLDLNYQPGIKAETIGSWQQTNSGGGDGGQSYEAERESILASYGSEGAWMI